jgi:hypothetical protein
MNIFNKDFTKLIINNYFIKDSISHYIYYTDSLYENLSLLLNEMINIPEYHKYCYSFNQNTRFINLDKLLDDYENLLEYQSIIMFIYEILLKLQLLDYYNNTIDETKLFEELLINIEFNFMRSLVDNISFNNEMNIISNSFKNI